MVLTVAVINLRHALYGASVAPYLQHLEMRWKLLLSYLLTDEAYVVAILHYEQTDAEAADKEGAASQTPVTDQRHWYFLGAGLALWTCWQLSTALGIFLGAAIPASWGLEFTLALTFIALVVPNLPDNLIQPRSGRRLVLARARRGGAAQNTGMVLSHHGIRR